MRTRAEWKRTLLALAVALPSLVACTPGSQNQGFVVSSDPQATQTASIDAGSRNLLDATLYGEGAPVLPSTGPNCSNPTAVGCPCATGNSFACTSNGCPGTQTCTTFGKGETEHSAWGPCNASCSDSAVPDAGVDAGPDAGPDAPVPADPPLSSEDVCANPDSAQLAAFLNGLSQGQIVIEVDAGPSCCVQCTGCVPGSVVWSYDSCIGPPEYCVTDIQQTCQPDGTWGPSVETGANFVTGCIHFWDGCDLNGGAGSYAGDCDGVFAGCNAPLSACPGSSYTNDFGNASPMSPEPQ